MDTPNDDQILGPSEDGNTTENPIENIQLQQNDVSTGHIENSTTNNVDTPQGTEKKGIELPTPEQILERLNNEIQNDFKQLETMADQQTPPTTEPTTPAAEKPKKKKEVETPLIVKKDQTVLILSIVVLLVAAGIFAWQNWKRRKDEENTIDMQQQAQKEYDEYNSYRQ